MGLFCFVELPSFLKTITLFSFSTPSRILPIFMMAQLVLLFRAIVLLQKPLRWCFAILISALLTIFLDWGAKESSSRYFITWILVILGVFLVSIIILSLTIQGRKRLQHLFVLIIAIFCFVSGVLVNPIQKGAAEIETSLLTQAISKITQQDPDTIWIVDSLPFPFGNIPIMAGAPTINSTNVYPNLERWYLLDPDHTEEDIYNRYAHITINLTSEETKFELRSTPDQFVLWLNPNDLDILEVEYIYTNRDLTPLNTSEVTFELTDQVEDQFIYHVIYS